MLASNKAELSPMLQSYLDYKFRYPDVLLLFQVGEFYEAFFQDAELLSREAGVTLTSRDKNRENATPMAGVPVHAIDTYLARLVSKGHSVALVSQEGSGKKVDRQLERIVTPGVRVLDSSFTGQRELRVGAVAISSGVEMVCTLAFTNPESGVIQIVSGISGEQLQIEAKRLELAELVLPQTVDGQSLDRRSQWMRALEGATAIRRYGELTAASREYTSIIGFQQLSTTGKSAVRALLQHVDRLTPNRQIRFNKIEQHSDGDALAIDPTTRRNLELVENARDGSEVGSLFWAINRTTTQTGARFLRSTLLQPLIDLAEINNRLDCVTLLKDNHRLVTDISQLIKGSGDLERIATRIELAAALPRELAALRDALESLRAVAQLVAEHRELSKLIPAPAIPETLIISLLTVLADQPGTLADGGVVKEGFDDELDRLRGISSVGRNWILELEIRERERTGISSLKIKYNNIFGYYIEITKANLLKVPADYIRRQTTVGGERYITPELKEREEELSTAHERALKLEREHYEKLRRDLAPYTDQLRKLSSYLGKLDMLLSFGQVAAQVGWCRPQISNMTEGGSLTILEGRHPVVAKLLGHAFVPNDIIFGGESSESSRALVITGPNMGGKSTYLRQAALLVILAQSGSHVPAAAMQFSICDRIAARIGASDNLMEGESTFMLEMREMADILRTATSHSLVLIDEIGRGTATADGLALARAILEWLAKEVRCKLMFATHFHELTALARDNMGEIGDIVDTVDMIVNLHVGVLTAGDEPLQFSHRIEKGAASKSYGIEVAELAGILPDIVQTARGYLVNNHASQLQNEVVMPVIQAVPSDKLREELRSTDLDNLTPRAALELLYKLSSYI